MVSLALLLQASAGHGFAPPLDTPFVYTTTETRRSGTRTLRFSARRRIVFRRDGDDGVIAELRFEHADHSADGGIGAMFARAFEALGDRPLRFHLDHDGAVTAIDDRDAVWDRLCAAIDGMGDTAARRKSAQAIAAALGGLPVARREAMLASMIEPLIADDLAAMTPGDTTASIPARTPTAPGATIPGRRHVARRADGTLSISVDADGDVLPPKSGGASVHVAISRRQQVDPVTGLVTSSRETDAAVTGIGAKTNTNETVTTATLTPLVS